MADVITSGKMMRPWSIRMKCQRCECLAKFTAKDVDTRAVGLVLDYLVCPECHAGVVSENWMCVDCRNKGTYVRPTEGWGGDHIDQTLTFVCPCSNMGGRPSY